MNISEKLVTIANNEQRVYDAGVGEGRKVEYIAFWDEYMPDRYEDYDSHFAGRGWNDTTFKPPYDIPRGDRSPSSFSRMFANTKITNLSAAMGDHKIQWNKATRADYMFYWSQVTEIPGADVSNIQNCYAMFNSATNLVTIGVFNVSPTTELLDAFFDCKALENIYVRGELAYANISFAQSTKLSRDSIESIIKALSKSASGKTITLSKTAVDKAFKDEDMGIDGSETLEWEDLCSDALGWSIYLI